MLYVQQSLGPREEIVYAARFHWMYTVRAVMWIILFCGAAILLAYMGVWWLLSAEIRVTFPDLPPEKFHLAWQETVNRYGGFLRMVWMLPSVMRLAMIGMFICGFAMFAHMMLIRATTEIAVTTERVVYKRGLISRDIGEINIDRIEGVAVHQGVLGRIFGYGRILIRGMGVGEVLLPTIAEPIEFRRAVQEAKNIEEREDIRAATTGDEF